MRGRGLRVWGIPTVIVLVLTVAAAAASPVAQLYAAVYPDQGSNVLTDGDSLEQALTEAALLTRFEPAELTENEPSRFTATIVYDTETSGDPGGVEVAFGNDASLTPVPAGQTDVIPVTPTRRYLNEGSARPDGGFELSWMWDVVPRASGQLTVVFEIQPVLVIDGVPDPDLAKRNEPITITVQVHPNRVAFNEIVAAAGDLELTIPAHLVAGAPTEVTAALSLQGREDVVQADISLATAGGSAAATISEQGPATSDRSGARLVGTWLVTPDEGGVVNLVFTVSVTAAAGDVPLEQRVETTRSVTADPKPTSLWDRIQAPVLWLTSIVGLIVALVALDEKVFGIRAKLIGRRHEAAALEDDA